MSIGGACRACTQCRHKIIKVTVVASYAGVNRIPLCRLGCRKYNSAERMVVHIELYTLCITASTGADKGTNALFRTIGFLEHIGDIAMGMGGC